MDNLTVPADVQPADAFEDFDNLPPPPDAVEDAPPAATETAHISTDRVLKPLAETAEAVRNHIAAFPVLSLLLAGAAGFGTALLIGRMRRA